ncbi:MAG: right-handed parallel beta-helix repeat-containing protein [Thermoplasmata archaeon]|nr:MAG: right-handed parallel beta-helix repeat-containing protein [Thermoplasmata archaeon]
MKKKLMSFLIPFLLVAGTLFGFFILKSHVVRGENIIYVGSGVGNDSTTINGGIGMAGVGYTVFVHSGIYIENVVVDITINLTGQDNKTTIIDGGASGDVITVTSDWVNITGFTITNGDYGIYIDSVSNNTIMSNIVHSNIDEGLYIKSSYNNFISNNNFSQNEYGIHIRESSDNNTIIDNIIWNNSVNGIYLSKLSFNNVTHNYISDNGGNGVYLYTGINVTLRDNSISNNNHGIYLTASSKNNTIERNIVINNEYGIHLGLAFNNTITDNTIQLNDWEGIRLHSSSKNNTIMDNNISSNGRHGIYLTLTSTNNTIDKNIISNNFDGVNVSSSSNNSITDNTIFNNLGCGVYLLSSSNTTIEINNVTNNLFGISLYYSNENAIKGNNVSYNGEYGIYLYSSTFNIVTENIATFNDQDGITIWYSSKNIVTDNNASSNIEIGIRVWGEDENNVTDNIVSNNQNGILLKYTDGNDISNNTVFSNADNGISLSINTNVNNIINNTVFSNGQNGIFLISSMDNNVTGNYIQSNSDCGINLASSSGNWIYHNHIIDNTNQARDDTNFNYWNDTYPSGGNFWSDFNKPDEGAYDDYQGPNQDILGSDDIVDNGSGLGGGRNPYIIDSDSQDNYPLTKYREEIPPLITNLQPSDASIINLSVPEIRANYTDISGINTSTVLLEVDGINVTSFADITAYNISYIPDSPLDDESHTVFLSVEDIWGNEATVSWSFVVDAITIPTVPQNLQASSGDSYVNLTWEVPESDGGSSIINYRIYKGTTSGDETFYQEIDNFLLFNDTDVSNGVTYYYKVSAVNEVGEGPLSEGARATPLSVPGAPLLWPAFSHVSRINITWEAPFSDGGSPITNYRIYRGSTPSAKSLIAEVGSKLLYYNDLNVSDGVSYYYEVSAVNALGEGQKSNKASATTPKVPTAPIELTSRSGDSLVTIYWNIPDSYGGSSISNYRIYRSTEKGEEGLLVEIDDSLFYRDSNVTNDVTYYYKVRAVNAVGEGPGSNEINETPRLDTDNDTIPDYKDWDDDNDGYLDEDDDFPLNSSEWVDTDGDGIGNNADPDDDNDGHNDDEDIDPLDPKVWKKDESQPPIPIWIWIVILGIILLFLVIIFLFMRKKRQTENKNTEEEKSPEDIEDEKEDKEP